MGGFDFTDTKSHAPGKTVEEAIRTTTLDYMNGQLGWSLTQCEQRVKVESARAIPKEAFDALTQLGWNLKGARLLDVGSGLGATALEALERGADAWGIEPGKGFRSVACMRLHEAGYDSNRISGAAGEALPFSDDSFDYVISLQVLEHVPDPLPLMTEMFRVLKRGGECYISCENYLSFREQHYRIPWFPLLPKPIGAAYLRLIGRNPAFLRDHVYYSTYPQIWRFANNLNFNNLTYDPLINRIESPESVRRRLVRVAARALQILPSSARRRFVTALFHLNAVWRVGVRVRLLKPVSE